jgi:formate/nitrite transporter
MEYDDFNAYVPAQMAARVEKAGITKGNLDSFSTFTQAMMAGTFISFGAVFFTYVIHDSTLSTGLTKLIGGLVFSLGLILVIITGAELFTGNSLIVMAYIGRKIHLKQLLRNWAIVFAGNLVGSLVIVYLIALSGQWTAGGAAVGVKALVIANGKVNLTFLEAISRGILCNILVCLAVYLCFSGRSVTDKILAILFPITAFVALGFEHSIANMYFIPAGLILKQNPQVIAAIPEVLSRNLDLSQLTTYGFVINNLLPVTLGNIIGGAFFVGIVHWFLFLRTPAKEPIRRWIKSGPPAVALDSSVAEAVKVMEQQGSDSVVIRGQEGAEGIVSEADIVRKVVALGLDPATMKVDQIMRTPLISVEVKTPIYEVYRTMTDHQVQYVLITDENQPLGFVSVKDLTVQPVA